MFKTNLHIEKSAWKKTFYWHFEPVYYTKHRTSLDLHNKELRALYLAYCFTTDTKTLPEPCLHEQGIVSSVYCILL